MTNGIDSQVNRIIARRAYLFKWLQITCLDTGNLFIHNTLPSGKTMHGKGKGR